MSAFSERVAERLAELGAAEQRVARYFQENPEEVLIASAAVLASRAQTSDATVVRTARALGFTGLDELRRALADEFRTSLTLADRLTRTLDEVGPGDSALAATLEIHRQTLEQLRRAISPKLFEQVVAGLVAARRVVVFGLGPSGAIATYFVLQLRRFSLEATALTHSGLLFADELGQLRAGDLVVMLAYGRVYAELDALLDAATQAGLRTFLVTDTLGARLRRRVELVLAVPRGRADLVSMHTATLGFLEALLVGVAAARPVEAKGSLERLNAARAKLVGRPHDLPVDDVDISRRQDP